MASQTLRAVLRKLASAVPSGLPLPIVRGPLRGARWIAGAAAGEGGGLSIVFNLAEPKQARLARSLPSGEDICFDVGANVGMYTLIFSKRARHVYAFEPFPRNIRYLSRMLSLNRVRNATIVPWAVADTLGLASFAEGPDCATGKIIPGAGQPVVTVSLDQFVSVYGAVPSVIKIDVEGSELDVLNGARELLRARRPVLLLSTHGPGLKEKCLALLKDLGYSRFTPLDGPGTPPGQEVDFAIMP